MELQKLSAALREHLPLGNCGAVIVAAGTASRMGGIDKVMAQLCGVPIVRRSALAFQKSDVITEIVIVTREDLIVPIRELCRDLDKVKAVVAGGSSRQESVWQGLNALSRGIALAAIHDGARPLVSQEIIERTVRAAHTYGAAAPGIAVKDTVKTVQTGLVTSTPDRAGLRAIQTPQVFDFDLLRGALSNAEKESAQLTDDCSAVERLGGAVRIVEGEERNLKVTTPMDLKIAQLFLEEKSCG